MVQAILYFVIIVGANIVGAISGMGGGVIIKPMLDFMGYDSVATISFYATVAVFMMALVSTVRQMQSGHRFNWTQIAWLAAGSVVGGYLGNSVFEWWLKIFPSHDYVTLVQIALTVLFMLFAWSYAKFDLPSFTWEWLWSYALCGVFLGFFASLLGIGGGPINVALLMLCFSMPIKDATVYSICIIFCSQLAKILVILLTIDLSRYPLAMLAVIIPAGCIGGMLGAWFSLRMNQNQVKVVFEWVIFGVILLNLYNGWQLLN